MHHPSWSNSMDRGIDHVAVFLDGAERYTPPVALKLHLQSKRDEISLPELHSIDTNVVSAAWLRPAFLCALHRPNYRNSCARGTIGIADYAIARNQGVVNSRT